MADEDMTVQDLAAQLKALNDLVQQLQVENAKLRAEVTQAPSASTTAHLGQHSNTANMSVDQQSSTTSTGLGGNTTRSVPSVAVERYVYVPRERKCPRFAGKQSQDSLTVEDWVEEARRHLSLRPMSTAEQALAIFDLLDGEARAEIKFRPAAERDDPEKIFTILSNVYGCSQSYISLQKQFFQRRQQDGESLCEFSHALMSLMEAVKRKDSACFAHPDIVMRDQFIEFVKDGMLRRELRCHTRLNPTVSFMEIRREAIRWVEEGEHSNAPRPRAQSCSTNSITEFSVESQVAALAPSTELAEVKESLRKQQAQLDTILKRLDTPLVSTGLAPPTLPVPPPSRVQARGSRYRFHPDGRPICLRCGQPGHIARFCKSEIATTLQTETVSVLPTQPSGN